MANIHPTAVIDPSARLDEEVVIEAHTYVGPRCEVGARTRLRPNVTLVQDVSLGADCDVHTGAVLGGDPQDLKYKGEPTRVEIGHRNVLREYVTVNRGTGFGGAVTRMGHGNLVMAYVHIAHDCVLGNGCILNNTVQLAGHIHIHDMAIISGSVLIHHFVTVGTMAFVAAASLVRADVPPYMIVEGSPPKVRKLNAEGMKRRHVPPGSMDALKEAYRVLYRSDFTLADGVDRLGRGELANDPYVANLLQHYHASARGNQGRALEALRADNGVKSATTVIPPGGNPFLDKDPGQDKDAGAPRPPE